MENPTEIDDLEVPPLFVGNLHIWSNASPNIQTCLGNPWKSMEIVHEKTLKVPRQWWTWHPQNNRCWSFSAEKNLSVTNRFWSSFGLPNLELYQCVTFALATVVFASGVYPVSDTRKYHIVYHRISRLYLIMPVKWCVCLSRLYANLPDYGMCGIPIISLYLLLKSLCFLVQPPIYLNIISEVTLSQFCTHISYIYI